MSVPKIETFEGQITEEIRDKESTMSDIVAASSQVAVGKERKNFTFLILGAIVLIFGTLIFGLVYFYNKKDAPYVNSPDDSLGNSSLTVATSSSGTGRGELTSIYTLLPRTSIEIGRFVESVSKLDNGYVIRLKEFEPVIAYLYRDESTFGQEAISLFGKHDEGVVAFQDITRSNLDIRVYQSTNLGIAYAFISTSTLVFATSIENILRLRGAIIK